MVPGRHSTRSYIFRADRAPDWEDGLTRAIAAVYPADGYRPIYRDYDLLVHFQDDFFNALYTLDNRNLGVRLRDANGNVVIGPDGTVLLPTTWGDARLTPDPAEDWWRKARAGNPVDPCEGSTPPPTDAGQTVLPIKLQDLALLPEMRYMAELIAVDRGARDANPTHPLARWSFTTSRFKTFSELATAAPHVPAFGLMQSGEAATQDFDALVRSFGAWSVAVVEDIRITPVRTQDKLAYLLIEAPEPLDDEANRLTVNVGGAVALLFPNIDMTRIVAALPVPIVLTSPQQSVTIALVWEAVPAGAPIERRRTIGGVAKQETCSWRVPLAELF